jgi:superfamily II DNA or RNA helicase
VQMLLRRRARLSATASRRVPVAVSLADSQRGVRIVIFHEGIAEAEQIASLLRERSHNVTLYHSRIAPAMRRDNLRLFRSGMFQILVSCRALDEGVNLPEAEIGIIASSTASTRQRIQRLGRVLRPAPGKQAASVYTLYATEVEERRLRAEAELLTGTAAVTWKRARIG